MIKPTQFYQITINDTIVGLLQSFEETVVREIKTQRTYRSNAINRLLPGAVSYIVKLKRVRTEITLPGEPEELHDFSMTLICEERHINYIGCEVSSLTMRVDANGAMIEEATIYAKTRVSIEE